VLELDLAALTNMKAFTGLLDAIGINRELEFRHSYFHGLSAPGLASPLVVKAW
jgi:hypothetical protein